jgi:hypothetical protein
MNLSKIASLVKSAQGLTVLDCNEGRSPYPQWIYVGYGIYPIVNMPRLTQSSIFEHLRISGKELKYYFDEQPLPSTIQVSDYTQSDVSATLYGMSIEYCGDHIRPILADGNLYFVLEQYLAPLDGSSNGVEYSIRDLDSKPYLVVRNGLLIIGIILLWHNIDEIFNRMIQAIARTSEHIFAADKASRMIETPIQMSASIDLETGEVTDDDGTDE